MRRQYREHNQKLDAMYHRRKGPDDDAREALKRLGVDECVGCDHGRNVRHCPIHGLNGTAPR